MADYVIFTDATADLTPEELSEYGIGIIPMEFRISEDTYVNYPDGREIAIEKVYDRMRAGEPTSTTQIGMMDYIQHFEPLLQAGKDILYIGFSSALSGTYNMSVLTSQELMQKYPERRIVCIDSFAASRGEGLLVYLAARKKAREDCPIEALEAWVIENRDHLCHWFTVDDLQHLRRGGRVSAVSAALGTVLNIKPVLRVDEEGRLIPIDKVSGRKKSIKRLFELMKEAIDPLEGQIIFIGHGDDVEGAAYLEKLIREEFKIEDVRIGFIGPVVGSHSGPGTIALFHLGTHK
jgi:DegV family protein with EDD domain